ncbi:MAG: hypothetical protein M3022_15415 [Actinomycetota bacterium]|nr:hypothetical protein [Actinomycetota bacterium]
MALEQVARRVDQQVRQRDGTSPAHRRIRVQSGNVQDHRAPGAEAVGAVIGTDRDPHAVDVDRHRRHRKLHTETGATAQIAAREPVVGEGNRHAALENG